MINQDGIATITINGEEVNLLFAMKMNRRWFIDMEENKDEWLTGMQPNETGYAYLLYYAYENDCSDKRIKSTIPFSSFARYVDDAFIDEGDHRKELQEAIACYEASSYTVKYFEKIEKETKMLEEQMQQVTQLLKKKRTGKKIGMK